MNVYILDIPSDWDNSPIFNVEDLVQFQGSTIMHSKPFVDPSQSEPELENSIPPNNPIHQKYLHAVNRSNKI